MESGSSSRVILQTNQILKCFHNPQKDFPQIQYHQEAYRITLPMTFLRVPKIHFISKRYYTMERINTSHPIFFSQISNLEPYKHHLRELRLFFKHMIKKSIFPYDFELYLQSDGTIMMIDFDKFQPINNNRIQVGQWRLNIHTDAYIQPALPIHFLKMKL